VAPRLGGEDAGLLPQEALHRALQCVAGVELGRADRQRQVHADRLLLAQRDDLGHARVDADVIGRVGWRAGLHLVGRQQCRAPRLPHEIA
jgi:hypothetical protein